MTLQVTTWSWAGLHAVMLRPKPWYEWERQKWKVAGELSNLDYLVKRNITKDPKLCRARWLASACNPRASAGGGGMEAGRSEV